MWRKGVSAALMVGAFSVMSAVVMATPSVASDGGQRIEIQDDCQPSSFNLAIGKGACIGDGETSFGAFIAEVQATQRAAAWKFDPSMLTIRAGRPVILKNEGGETHTFTMVKAFGGGFVPILNQLSGNPVPAAECSAAAGKVHVPMLHPPLDARHPDGQVASCVAAGRRATARGGAAYLAG